MGFYAHLHRHKTLIEWALHAQSKASKLTHITHSSLNSRYRNGKMEEEKEHEIKTTMPHWTDEIS